MSGTDQPEFKPELKAEEWDFFVTVAGEVPPGRRRFVTLHEYAHYDSEPGEYEVTTHGDATTAHDAEAAARQYHEGGYAFVYAVGTRQGEPMLWQWVADEAAWPPGGLEEVRRVETPLSRAPRARLSALGD